MKANKRIKEQQLFETQQKEEGIANALRFSRKRFKKFDEIILQLYLEKDLSSFFSDRRIWKIHECFSRMPASGIARADLKNVFLYLYRYSSLISGEEYIQTVLNMVHFKNHWRNDIYCWKPVSNRGSTQVQELAFYLFCEYQVPEFLYKAFFEQQNRLYITWFVHLGLGKRAKYLPNVPISFSQKMAHYFLQAPGNLSIHEALRWAQVRGMNGDTQLANRVAYSWIGSKAFEQEKFWEAFLRIIVDGGMFNHDELTQLIDYVRESKRVNPEYNLKGRTLQSLLRQSYEWHKQAILLRGNQIWKSCGIREYRIERKEECLLLEELMGSRLLVEEGRIMKHCVGSYIPYCVAGRSAIFSFRRYVQGVLMERMATVEVNLFSKRIVQAKAKMNGKISAEVMKHLETWANKNGFTVNPYL
jgi:hypothetical protein